MWWRLTTDAVKKVIENNGTKFFEKKLLDKYQISVQIVNQDIFFGRWKDLEEDEKNYHHVGSIAAIQEYYKYKGNQLEDYDEIIMDELVRADSERRTFDIPAAFINMIENVCRTRDPT